MNIYAVGDIHGNLYLLSKLLQKIISEGKKNDLIIFLGDIIDGGDHTKECIELILKIQREKFFHVIAIKGNHEEWMLNTLGNFKKHSWIISMEGLNTIKSYSQEAHRVITDKARETGPTLITEKKPLPYNKFFENVPINHINFIKTMKSYYKVGNYIFTHAGIDPICNDLNEMEDRKFRWGFEGFPEYYKGKNVIVYGHFSKRAKELDGKIIPHIENNTICLDTQNYGVLSALKIPGKKLIQVF